MLTNQASSAGKGKTKSYKDGLINYNLDYLVKLSGLQLNKKKFACFNRNMAINGL
jgi:hypothetical protein